MFYSKALDSAAGPDTPKYDPIAILRELNYFPFVHERNKQRIADALRDDDWKRVFCDMSAAATTQLYHRDMIDIEHVWYTVATFFHQAIQMRGFRAVPAPESELTSDYGHPGQIELLVAGTQAPPIYRARVDGCLRILHTVTPPRCRITFAGANPHKANLKMGFQGGVRTLNEAADMELYFRSQLRKQPLPHGIQFNLHRESESESTLRNIEYFFENIASDLSPARPCHIYVVSSLYHLPRFIDLTLDILRQRGLPVTRLTFVSAEDPLEALPVRVRCTEFIKSCMFEFYWQLYSNTPPEQICQVGGTSVLDW